MQRKKQDGLVQIALHRCKQLFGLVRGREKKSNYTIARRRIMKTEIGYVNSACEVKQTSCQCDTSMVSHKHADPSAHLFYSQTLLNNICWQENNTVFKAFWKGEGEREKPREQMISPSLSIIKHLKVFLTLLSGGQDSTVSFIYVNRDGETQTPFFSTENNSGARRLVGDWVREEKWDWRQTKTEATSHLWRARATTRPAWQARAERSLQFPCPPAVSLCLWLRIAFLGFTLREKQWGGVSNGNNLSSPSLNHYCAIYTTRGQKEAKKNNHNS